MAEQRYAQVHRKTNETDISLTLILDGNGKQDIATGIGFLIICFPDSPDTGSLIWI